MSYDFSGWATRSNVRCGDGRVISDNAFADNDGLRVPLMWNHQHDSTSKVLGHADLKNVPGEGVYAFCKFNNTTSGREAKEMLRNGDVSALSIFANQLKEAGHNVLHGAIKEVSMVLAGCNPGAFIDNVEFAHGEDGEFSAYIYNDMELDEDCLMHSDEEYDDEDEYYDPDEEYEDDEYDDSDEEYDDEDYEDSDEEYYEDEDYEDGLEHGGIDYEAVIDSMTDEQQDVLYDLAGEAYLQGAELAHSDEDGYYFDEGGATMAHSNVWENSYLGADQDDTVLEHGEFMQIVEEAKTHGSLKESFLAHGIDNIEYLFPDARNLDNPPQWIKREDTWVTGVMNDVHHTPFSRIKSIFADITADEARAKGYIKGNYKTEEVFTLLKRTTTPTTVYKKQSFDRDDILDITEFDVIPWVKTEMRFMLNEELARAFLVGDGRPGSSNDKINELNIRPIWTDDDLFTVKVRIEVPANANEDDIAKAVIRGVIKSRKLYKGTGNPKFYTTDDYVTDMLLLTDLNGRDIYDTEDKLTRKLRVRSIVNVPVMEGLRRTVPVEGGGTEVRELVGIIVNLTDYNVGADKGGAVNMFDDFDIDYNKQKYLIETRCSAALTKPFSAMAIELVRKSN